MQIEGDQSVCPACGSATLELYPVFHHMICAYVGPQYDFAPAVAGYTCPKCRRAIVSGDHACEIVGTSARCISQGNGGVAPFAEDLGKPELTSAPGQNRKYSRD